MKKALSLFLALALTVGLLVLPAAAAEPEAVEVEAAQISLWVNDTARWVWSYNIGGNNYFRLRDMAALFQNTEAQFSIEWSEEAGTVDIIPGGRYQPDGTELSAPAAGLHTATVSTQELLLDHYATDSVAYNIDGSNYFRLRDVAALLDVGVAYAQDTGIVYLNTRSSYDSGAVLPEPGTVPMTVEQTAQTVDSTVMVCVLDEEGYLINTCSGFFIRSDGWVATCAHAFNQGDEYASVAVMDPDGNLYSVSRVIAYDFDADLAIFKADGITHAVPVPIGDSDSLVRGQTVVFISSPQRIDATVTSGIVSAIRDGSTQLRYEGMTDIQMTAPASSGSSGGVMLDLCGNAMGIYYCALSRAPYIGFCISSNELAAMIRDKYAPISLEDFIPIAKRYPEELKAREEAEKEEQSTASAGPDSTDVSYTTADLRLD